MSFSNITNGADQATSETGLHPLDNRTMATTAHRKRLVNDATGSPDGGKVDERQATKPLRGGQGRIDPRLIERAIEIVESTESSDPIVRSTNLHSLSAVLSDMWETGLPSSPFHQALLAGIESAVIQLAKSDPSRDSTRLSAVREALIDLGQRTITSAHIESVGSIFIDEGFGTAAPFTNDSPSSTIR